MVILELRSQISFTIWETLFSCLKMLGATTDIRDFITSSNDLI